MAALLLAQLCVGGASSVSAAVNPPPGGQVLVITDPANPFTTYYTEILRAEGLNEFATADLADVDATALAAHSVVVLGEMSLTTPQATMFETWVNGGGNLIAMRPDKKLASLLGLSDAGATRADAYLKIDNSSGPGKGIVGTPIQYHGTADRYTLAGATAVATLYADASTSTANPAVTMRSVGSQGGQAVAFTYDLARSIVLTRQGNPAWAGQQRDGVDGYEAAEMFMGTGGQPDWNNLDNALIPIADEQQRLLANLITQTNLDAMPLPRLWYYPRGLKAVLVMSADDHGYNGTVSRFQRYDDLSPANCVVENWECIRSSSYLYPSTPMLPADAVRFTNAGFEVGVHVTTNCTLWGTPADLETMYSTQIAQWAANFPGLPNPSSSRTHCVEWDDWATQAKTKLAHGMRMDTDYYYFPAAWVAGRPGYFNGTAGIQRFADVDGTLIDEYQATTQLTDESGLDLTAATGTLLDNALNSKGYYAALTANMHTDIPNTPESEAVLAATLARNVPIVSPRQMLTWLDARNASSFQATSWNGSALTFTLAGGANQLTGMVPTHSATGTLSTLTSGGSAVPYTVETIKGIEYAFFSATPRSYTATYVSPQLSVNPGSVSFGTVTTGTTASRTLTIANTGTGPLTISSTTAPSAPFGVSGLPANGTVIAPGGDVTATVTYLPTSTASSNGTIGITTDGGTASISLSGTGNAPTTTTAPPTTTTPPTTTAPPTPPTPSGPPTGNVDSAAAIDETYALVNGWAGDVDAPNTPISVLYTVDGRLGGLITADRARADVAANEAPLGPNHGFSAVVAAPGTNALVCMRALNVGAGESVDIGCKRVTRTGVSPVGNFDSVRTSGSKRATIAGWAADGDAPRAPLALLYSVNGRLAGIVGAGKLRLDLARARPGFGAYHGFSATISAPGRNVVICVRALNVGGGSSTDLGCRRITRKR